MTVSTPVVEKEKMVEEVPIQRTASPGEMNVDSEKLETKLPSRAASDVALASRCSPAHSDGTQPAVAPNGLSPASAIPTRLLSAGSTAAIPNVPPFTNANLLSEALLMERGRRRLAAAGQPVPPPPAILHVPSAVGLGRAAMPSRQPTPPSAAIPGTQSMPPPISTGIISPITTKRMPKFKSVPTPISGTPVPGQNMENPMEMIRSEEVEKEGE